MCGVCGEIRFDGRPADAHAVARMTDAMAARGPDSDGVFARGPIALGHRRLSIIDLSPRGGQPMIDSDLGLALVFNGCIYNYRALREELEGIVVESSPTGSAEASQAKATVLLRDPAVRARLVGGASALELGAAVRVRVDSADPGKRTVTLSVA